MMIDEDVVRVNVRASGLTRTMRLWMQAGGRCHYCRRPMLLKPEGHGNSVTAEHVVPRANGGRFESNIVGACRRCNSLRGSLDYEWFRHIVASLGDRLPEVGTPRYREMQGSLHRLAMGLKTRVRLPGRRA